MADHYAQCPVRNSTNWPAKGPVFCLCYLIAKIEAEVRERIAQEIEAGCVHGRILKPDMQGVMVVGAMDLCYRCAHAARIARGGER